MNLVTRGPTCGNREGIEMKFFVSLLVLLIVPMMTLNGLGRPAFTGYYLGVMTLWVVFACANARAARGPATE